MSVGETLRTTSIRELRPLQPLCLEPQTRLSDALANMRSSKASCVLVCEMGEVTGILTERDILIKVAGEKISLDSPIEQFMTPHPKVLTANDRLSDAVLLMDAGDYRHVPIVDGSGRVEGIISIHNVIEFLAEIFPEEVLNLPPRPNQSMTTQEGG